MHTFKDSCLKVCLDRLYSDIKDCDAYGFLLFMPWFILFTMISIPVSIAIDFVCAIYKAINK